jgi:hypothetical protein
MENMEMFGRVGGSMEKFQVCCLSLGNKLIYRLILDKDTTVV